MRNLRHSICLVMCVGGLALLIAACAPTPASAPAPATTPLSVGNTCQLPEGVGICRFVSSGPDSVVIELNVPQQNTPGSLTFQSLLPNGGFKDPTFLNPTRKEIYQVFMGLNVKKGGQDVIYFDPAITVTVTYSQKVLDDYANRTNQKELKTYKSFNDISLFWNDGKQWQRLPIVKRDPVGKTVSALMGSFAAGDDMGDGG